MPTSLYAPYALRTSPHLSTCASRRPRPPTLAQVKEVTSQYTHKDFRWKAEALLALQEMAEQYLTALLEDA